MPVQTFDSGLDHRTSFWESFHSSCFRIALVRRDWKQAVPFPVVWVVFRQTDPKKEEAFRGRFEKRDRARCIGQGFLWWQLLFGSQKARQTRVVDRSWPCLAIPTGLCKNSLAAHRWAWKCNRSPFYLSYRTACHQSFLSEPITVFAFTLHWRNFSSCWPAPSQSVSIVVLTSYSCVSWIELIVVAYSNLSLSRSALHIRQVFVTRLLFLWKPTSDFDSCNSTFQLLYCLLQISNL